MMRDSCTSSGAVRQPQPPPPPRNEQQNSNNSNKTYGDDHAALVQTVERLRDDGGDDDGGGGEIGGPLSHKCLGLFFYSTTTSQSSSSSATTGLGRALCEALPGLLNQALGLRARYSAPWPLGVILDSWSMARYETAHACLLRHHLCLSQLRSIFRVLNLAANRLDHRRHRFGARSAGAFGDDDGNDRMIQSQLRALQLLRHRLQFVATVLTDHFAYEVAACWKNLQRVLKKMRAATVCNDEVDKKEHGGDSSAAGSRNDKNGLKQGVVAGVVAQGVGNVDVGSLKHAHSSTYLGGVEAALFLASPADVGSSSHTAEIQTQISAFYGLVAVVFRAMSPLSLALEGQQLDHHNHPKGSPAGHMVSAVHSAFTAAMSLDRDTATTFGPASAAVASVGGWGAVVAATLPTTTSSELGTAGHVLGSCVRNLCEALFIAQHHVRSAGAGRGQRHGSGAAALAYEVLAGRLADFFLFGNNNSNSSTAISGATCIGDEER